MFDGYFSYGGQEIINAQRTRAYLAHLQPTLHVGEMCCDCDTLGEVIGDGPYDTPAQDDAEWFNPYAPETGGFYGLIPLGVEGLEDSTWTVPLTDMMGDGSISGRGRRAGRDIRFKALAVAESEKAMSRGLSWLRDALGAEGCASGDCGGAQLCYLTDCPGCCEDDGTEPLTVVDHLDYRAMSTTAAATAARADWVANSTPTGVVRATRTYARWITAPVILERTVDGLVPGATYRIAMDFGGTTAAGGENVRVVVKVPGAAERLPERAGGVAFGFAPSPDQGVAVWDFIATECTHRFVIEADGVLALGMWDVSLVAQGSLSYSGQPWASDAYAGAWTSATMDFPQYLTTETFNGQWRFTAASGTTTLDAERGSVRTLLTGLIPGKRYRVTALGTTDVLNTTVERGLPAEPNPTATATATPGLLRVVDPTTTKDLVRADTPSTLLRDGFHGGWTTLEFTAQTTGGFLVLSNKNAFTVGAPVYAVTAIHAAFIEQVGAVPELPDPHRSLNRYLRDVVLTSGPRTTKVHPAYTAVMHEIEWTMRANRPDPLGDDVLIATNLGPYRWTVPEVACSLGEPVRQNLVPNPSGEYGVTGWTLPGGSPGFTLTNPTDATAKSGTHVLRITNTTTGNIGRSIGMLANTPVKAGTPLTMSLYARAAGVGRYVRITYAWYKGATFLFNESVDRPLVESTEWQLVTMTQTAPPGATDVAVGLVFFPGGPWAVNDIVDFDAVLLERTYGARTFFDGDSQFGTWAGTPGNSVSTYKRTAPKAVYDPACPPSPEPPRPPDIVNVCLTTPANWFRYVLDLPALAAATAPRAAPTISVSTGSNEARGIRVRVYANPQSLSVEDLDPCGFCGEFLISYMPPNSSLTIDAADQTASIATQQGVTNAVPLLYGGDGGPITWPMLSCALPYYVTVDVDAVTPPLIATSLSVTPIF